MERPCFKYNETGRPRHALPASNAMRSVACEHVLDVWVAPGSWQSLLRTQLCSVQVTRVCANLKDIRKVQWNLCLLLLRRTRRLRRSSKSSTIWRSPFRRIQNLARKKGRWTHTRLADKYREVCLLKDQRHIDMKIYNLSVENMCCCLFTPSSSTRQPFFGLQESEFSTHLHPQQLPVPRGPRAYLCRAQTSA